MMRRRSIAPPTASTAREQAAPAGPERSGWNCAPATRPSPTRLAKPPSVHGPCEASSVRRRVLDRVAVREVAGRREGRGERVRPLAGSTSFQPMCGSRRAPSSRVDACRAAGRGTAVVALLAALEQQLQADAHAEQVGAAASARHDRVDRGRARAARPSPARPRRRPGSRRSARRRDLLGLVAHGHLGAGALERRAQRAQVARAVVDERDAITATPFVRDAAAARDRARQAARSASATALKAASATWWSSSPVARDVQADPRPRRAKRVEEVRHEARRHAARRGSPQRRARCAAMPRPERSTVASASASSSGARAEPKRRTPDAVAERAGRAPRRARSRSPRRCGARRSRGRRRSAARGRSATRTRGA